MYVWMLGCLVWGGGGGLSLFFRVGFVLGFASPRRTHWVCLALDEIRSVWVVRSRYLPTYLLCKKVAG